MFEGRDESVVAEFDYPEIRTEDSLLELLSKPIHENFPVQSRRVTTFRTYKPVYDVVYEMRKCRKGAAVIESDDKIAGIFTDRDFLRASKCLPGTPVGELMTVNVQSLPVTAKTEYLLNWFADNGLRHIPLVKNGMACGIVSARDLLELICARLRRHRVFHTPVSDVVGRDAKSVRRHLIVNPDDRIDSAIEKMTVFSGGAVRVVEKGKLVGIVSERDVSRVILGEAACDDRISDIMTTAVYSARSNELLRHAMARMVRRGVRHLPIVDENAQTTGILVQRDPLRLIVEYFPVIHNLPDNPEQKFSDCEG